MTNQKESKGRQFWKILIKLSPKMSTFYHAGAETLVHCPTVATSISIDEWNICFMLAQELRHKVLLFERHIFYHSPAFMNSDFLCSSVQVSSPPRSFSSWKK